MDEQHDEARDRREQDKAQDCQGGKSESGLLNGLGLTQRAWSGSDGLELSELIAA